MKKMVLTLCMCAMVGSGGLAAAKAKSEKRPKPVIINHYEADGPPVFFEVGVGVLTYALLKKTNLFPQTARVRPLLLSMGTVAFVSWIIRMIHNKIMDKRESQELLEKYVELRQRFKELHPEEDV